MISYTVIGSYCSSHTGTSLFKFVNTIRTYLTSNIASILDLFRHICCSLTFTACCGIGLSISSTSIISLSCSYFVVSQRILGLLVFKYDFVCFFQAPKLIRQLSCDSRIEAEIRNLSLQVPTFVHIFFYLLFFKASAANLVHICAHSN